MDTIETILNTLHLAAFASDVKTFFVTATWSRVAVWMVVTAGMAVAMEYWAAYVHRVFWHRSLMVLHRSHHRLHDAKIEANDIFAIVHAPLAIAIIVAGVLIGPTLAGDLVFSVGAGITAFGMLYFIFHDGMVHGRLPVTWLARFEVFRKWKEAHHMHHKTGAYPYGFFRGPSELKARQ